MRLVNAVHVQLKIHGWSPNHWSREANFLPALENVYADSTYFRFSHVLRELELRSSLALGFELPSLQ